MEGFAPQQHDRQTGLLTTAGLDSALDAELSRAARHELPLSLVFLELSGRLEQADEARIGRVARAVAAAIEGRVRREDRVARIGTLKFAVIAVQTSESGTLATDLAEQVRFALQRIGEAGHGLSVAAGAVDCHYDELSSMDLLRAAERALATAALTGGDVAFPSAAQRRSPASSASNGPR
jgi:diguanylate cyclase (GGDEF)-like protein